MTIKTQLSSLDSVHCQDNNAKVAFCRIRRDNTSRTSAGHRKPSAVLTTGTRGSRGAQESTARKRAFGRVRRTRVMILNRRHAPHRCPERARS